MTASKHTPGPWSIQYGIRGEDGPYRPGIDSDATDFTIILWGEEFEEVGIRGRTPEEARANARLVAAAPVLLGTLQDLHNRLSEAVQLGLTAQEAYDSFYQEMVGEALSKATGASHE